MNKILVQNFETPFGELILGAYQSELCLCDWRFRKMRTAIDSRIQTGLQAVYTEGISEVIELAKYQLTEYFAGVRKVFDIPLLLVGTEFQKKVWNELLTIPWGVNETYFGLARRLNNPLAIRAVSSANGANALSIFVPCHRIIGSNNNLVGYAGGLPAKKRLLTLEGGFSNGQLFFFE